MEGLSFLPWVTDTCAMVWARREAAPPGAGCPHGAQACREGPPRVLGVPTGCRHVGRVPPPWVLTGPAGRSAGGRCQL